MPKKNAFKNHTVEDMSAHFEGYASTLTWIQMNLYLYRVKALHGSNRYLSLHV